MHYGKIKTFDIADGLGIRVALYVSGCRHHCPGCFQPETWNFKYGKEYTQETQEYILKELRSPYKSGLTLLGGEPFEIENQLVLVELLKLVKQQFPDKNIWCYTGYTLDKDLIEDGKSYCEVTNEMLSYIDVLVDGEFKEELKDITLKFKGSSNQRVIDLNKTRIKNPNYKEIILLEEYE